MEKNGETILISSQTGLKMQFAILLEIQQLTAVGSTTDATNV
jgi:hypothetical protein